MSLPDILGCHHSVGTALFLSTLRANFGLLQGLIAREQ
jgi:hypothetical protein